MGESDQNKSDELPQKPNTQQKSAGQNTTTIVTVGNFEIGQTIGMGTFGKVKLGIHKITNEKVAVKVMDKEKLVDPGDKKRLQREISILRKIRHPNIIQLFEIIETPHQLYLFMEYAPNGELFDYIVKRTRLSERHASKFLQQIINGIEYLSKIGVVHRDLKPENLLLDHNYNIKIVDFGLSNVYKDKSEKLTTACGSPCYAAPEMVAGKPYFGLQTDIWSAGVILYAMLCGYLPFEDSNTSELYKKIINQDPQLPSFLSKSAKGMLMGILAKDPNKRYSIQDIRLHPFCKEREPILEGIVVGQNDIPIDQTVVNQLKNYNINLETATEMIQKNKHNSITSTYSLLLLKFIREGGKSKADLNSLRKTRSDNLQNITPLNGTACPPKQSRSGLDQRNAIDLGCPDQKVDISAFSQQGEDASPIKKQPGRRIRESSHQPTSSDLQKEKQKIAAKYNSISPVRANYKSEDSKRKSTDPFYFMENSKQENEMKQAINSVLDSLHISSGKQEYSKLGQGTGFQRRNLFDNKTSKMSNYGVPSVTIKQQNSFLEGSLVCNPLNTSQQQKIASLIKMANNSSLESEDLKYPTKQKSYSLHQNQNHKFVTSIGDDDVTMMKTQQEFHAHRRTNGKFTVEAESPLNKNKAQLQVLLSKNLNPNSGGGIVIGQSQKEQNSTSTNFKSRYLSVQRQQVKNPQSPTLDDKKHFRIASYSIHNYRGNNSSQNGRNSNDSTMNLSSQNNCSKRSSVNTLKNPLQEKVVNLNGGGQTNQRIRKKYINASFHDNSFLNISGNSTNNNITATEKMNKENNLSISNSRKDIKLHGRTEEIIVNVSLPPQKLASLEVETGASKQSTSFYKEKSNRDNANTQYGNLQLGDSHMKEKQQQEQSQIKEIFSSSFKPKRQEGSKSENLRSSKIAPFYVNQQQGVPPNQQYTSGQSQQQQQQIILIGENSTKSNSKIASFKFRKVKPNMYEEVPDLNTTLTNLNNLTQFKNQGLQIVGSNN